MWAKLKPLVKNIWFKKAVVLMYHRVDNLEQDVWNLAVSPQNFEQHLQVLQSTANVLAVPELVAGLEKQKLAEPAVAITFDDGYLDNYTKALPLLERYGLPATFFIASGNIGAGKEFWWDELEHLILESETLPPSFAMVVGGTRIEQNLEGETTLTGPLQEAHRRWKASEENPPTRRSLLFYTLWAAMRPMPHLAQQELLQVLHHWAQQPAKVRTGYTSMSAEQLALLARSPMATIGAHTCTHPALSCHPRQYQAEEIAGNTKHLFATAKVTADVLAYPFGLFNEDSVAVAQAAGMKAAFTTTQRPLYRRSPRYQLGRFEVNDWDKNTFKTKLQQWFQQSI